MKPINPYRKVPLGLQLCRFLFATEKSKPIPVPGKPWVALVCDPNDERFYDLIFCAEAPDGVDFERLLLRFFDRTNAQPEFVEVDDVDLAIDVGSFCAALEIRIEVRDSLPMAEKKKKTLLRNGVVSEVSRSDESDGSPDDFGDDE